MMNPKNQNDTRQAIAKLCEECLQPIVAKLKEISSSSCLSYSGSKNHISNDDQQNSVCLIEIRLWTQLKEYIGAHETVLLNYIHGFYSYLLQVVTLLIDNPARDVYFTRSRSITKLLERDFNENNNDEVKLLLYNINIRLGDLNRYLKNIKLARYYYNQARELNPLRGHAYNQLALVSTSEVLKTLYYSTRALLAVEDPVKHAEATLNSLLKKCALINPNIDNFLSERFEAFDPSKVDNWLYLIVLAIYCEKRYAILYHIFREATELLQASLDQTVNPSRLPNDDRFVLSALDVMIDAIEQKTCYDKLSAFDLEAEFTDLISLLSFYIAHDDSVGANSSISVALRHDFTLYGLSFLKPIHDKIDFSQVPSEENNARLLLRRLSFKLDKLYKTIYDKKIKTKTKKCRNIALQSILGSKGAI